MYMYNHINFPKRVKGACDPLYHSLFTGFQVQSKSLVLKMNILPPN